MGASQFRLREFCVTHGRAYRHRETFNDGWGCPQVLSEVRSKSASISNCFTHTDDDFFGPKIDFDIFRFESGKVVEHWDTCRRKPAKPNPSGHTVGSLRGTIDHRLNAAARRSAASARSTTDARPRTSRHRIRPTKAPAKNEQTVAICTNACNHSPRAAEMATRTVSPVMLAAKTSASK